VSLGIKVYSSSGIMMEVDILVDGKEENRYWLSLINME
jgi:hypothetical protein